jgi:hypothetical protein
MPTPANQLITSRSEFHEALQLGFAHAAAVGCRELWLCDESFADWPLGAPCVVESLAQWATSQRRLTLLARHFNEVERLHPRWVVWRRTWSHIVQCRANTELEAGSVPTFFWAPDVISVRLSNTIHHRGRLSCEMSESTRCRELTDAVLQHSEEAFPSTTIGL